MVRSFQVILSNVPLVIFVFRFVELVNILNRRTRLALHIYLVSSRYLETIRLLFNCIHHVLAPFPLPNLIVRHKAISMGQF